MQKFLITLAVRLVEVSPPHSFFSMSYDLVVALDTAHLLKVRISKNRYFAHIEIWSYKKLHELLTPIRDTKVLRTHVDQRFDFLPRGLRNDIYRYVINKFNELAPF